jgi:hypothetical protein
MQPDLFAQYNATAMIQSAVAEGLKLVDTRQLIVNDLLVLLATARLTAIATAYQFSQISTSLSFDGSFDDTLPTPYLEWSIEAADEAIASTRLYLGNPAIPDYLAAIAFNLRTNQTNFILKGLTIPRATANLAHLQDYKPTEKWQVYPF